MANTKVAIVGVTDPHANGYLDMAADMTDLFSGVVLYDPDADALAAAQQQYPDRVTGVHTDYEALLADEEVGLLVLTVCNRDKPEMIVKAAQAGKHVIAEKPVARNPAELRPALDAVRAAGIQFSVWYPWRANPVTQHVRRLMAEGTFGDVWSFEGRFSAVQVTRGVTRATLKKDWLFFRETSGGGILSWLGVHWIDLFRYLIGEVESVSAMVTNRVGTEVDVEDVACVLLRCANGAVGTLRTGWYLPFGSKDLYLGLEGEIGCFQWWPADSRLVVRSQRPDWNSAPEREFTFGGGADKGLLPGNPRTPFARSAWIDQFFRDFVAAVREGREPAATGEDALRVLEVLEAAYESARTGREVMTR